METLNTQAKVLNEVIILTDQTRFIVILSLIKSEIRFDVTINWSSVRRSRSPAVILIY